MVCPYQGMAPLTKPRFTRVAQESIYQVILTAAVELVAKPVLSGDIMREAIVSRQSQNWNHTSAAGRRISTHTHSFAPKSPTEEMVGIILADNQVVFRTGTAIALAMELDVKVVAQAETIEQMMLAAETFRGAIL